MPEEKKGIFDDLPDERPTGGDPAGGDPEEKKPEATLEDDSKKKQREEEIKNLEKANKEEKRKLEALETLKQTRLKRKQMEKELKDEDAGKDEPEVKPEVKPTTDDGVRETVRKTLDEERTKQYEMSIDLSIKERAKDKQEAMAAAEEARKLPKTGNAKLDAEFALERVRKLKEYNRGYVPPSMSGGGFVGTPDYGSSTLDSGINEAQREQAKRLGLTEEDLKKYNDDVNLTSVFKH